MDEKQNSNLVPSIFRVNERDAERAEFGQRLVGMELIWKKLVNKSIREGNFAAMLHDLPVDDVSDPTSGLFVTEDTYGVRPGDHYFGAVVEPVVLAVIKQAPKTATVAEKSMARRDRILEGMEYFWFCLGVLADSTPLLSDHTPDVQQQYKRVLQRLLVWWPTLCDLDGRLAGVMYSPSKGVIYGRSGHWTRWGAAVLSFSREIGVPTADEIENLRNLSMYEAGEVLGRWVS